MTKQYHKVLAAGVLALGASLSAGAYANDDACGSELCLAAPAMGLTSKLPTECKGPAKKFFDIRKTKKGSFKAGSTARARESYLNQCKSGNTKEKKAIISKFGRSNRMPSGLF